MENSLLENKPELAKEWHPFKNGSLSPDSVTIGSNKKVWWLGKCGHEWQAVIASRSKGSGCPFCVNYKVLTGFNDLATTNPEIAQEWHPTKNGDLTPNQVISGGNKKVWWLGKCGHEWQQTIQNRKNGQGCPYCKNMIVAAKATEKHIDNKGSLLDNNPQLAKEWHPFKNGSLTPDVVTNGSKKKVWWLGKCGHEWQASISNRSKGNSCPYCSNQKALKGFNDLEALFPEIAQEWHPTKNADLRPDMITAGSGKKVWWLGKCGHEWQQTVKHRTIRGQGCPICGKRLQTSFPEQALYFYIKKLFPDAENSYQDIFDSEMELDIYIPSLNIGIEYDGINWHSDKDSERREKKKYEICKQHKVTLIRIKEEFNNNANQSCDVCFRAVRHANSRETDKMIAQLLYYLGAHSDVDVERDEIDIRSMYYTGSNTVSFAEVTPELLLDWDYEKNGKLDPYSLSISSGVYVWWKCHICGYEWKQRIAARSKGVGCKNCGYRKRSDSRIKNRIKKQGSLLDNNNSLAKEWHPTKNAPLTPAEVLSGSGRKVWWVCSKCGHEWMAEIGRRNRGAGCPVCNRHGRVNEVRE
ncbi:MAG: zinc-ribbon domain-containing protein [Oscillospiraceae bacterium]|nr:zinc-ribbon domain-containing protein [Oscillospiraceae bacterium]